MMIRQEVEMTFWECTVKYILPGDVGAATLQYVIWSDMPRSASILL